MRIWLEGKWYNHKDHLLVEELSDQDKKNIENMHPDCTLYAQYDENNISTDDVKKILNRLKGR